MPAKHYVNLLKHIKKSRMLKLQASVLFLTTYIDWVLMPFITKLEGTYLPVMMISFYMLLGASDGFVQPLFKNIKIHRIYLFVILLDIVQICTYFLVTFDMKIFTYMILSIFTLQAITFEISRVHTIDFMKDDIDIKDYLMLRSFVVSGAIILGSGCAIILDYLSVSLATVLLALGIFGVFAILIEFKLFMKFRKAIQNEQTEIFRSKILLNEKINV